VGWLAFVGNVRTEGGSIKLAPFDSARPGIYLAPYGLWLTLESGKFDAVELNPKTGAVRLRRGARTLFTTAARLRIEQPAKIDGVGTYALTSSFKSERAAHVVPLVNRAKWVE